MNLVAAIDRIEKKFDVEFCYKWVDHVQETIKKVIAARVVLISETLCFSNWFPTACLQMYKEVRVKMKERFDTLPVPRSVTINDLLLALVINLVCVVTTTVLY